MPQAASCNSWTSTKPVSLFKFYVTTNTVNSVSMQMPHSTILPVASCSWGHAERQLVPQMWNWESSADSCSHHLWELSVTSSSPTASHTTSSLTAHNCHQQQRHTASSQEAHQLFTGRPSVVQQVLDVILLGTT